MEERFNHKRSLKTRVKTHFNKCELTDLKLQTFVILRMDVNTSYEQGHWLSMLKCKAWLRFPSPLASKLYM